MRTPLRVLLIEDSEDEALLLVRALERGGYAPQWERVETAAGMSAAQVAYYDTSSRAAAELPGRLVSGDLVLVKGSRGTRMDVVVDAIVAARG